MKVLVLGGTAFVGRYAVEAALARGHTVTLFNRGQTQPDLFPNVEHLRGDRDHDLAALHGKEWDAVIDTSGYVSHAVRATAELLAPKVHHYTFISSISVYGDPRAPGLDEHAPVETLAQGTAEDINDVATYGARKVLCEQAAEQCMPGRVLNIRAGLVIGPHDYIDRFVYWLRRVARGGEVLAPGRPERPIQVIDVRDLAVWIIQMIEAQRTGIYNATGPNYTLTMEGLLQACATATGSTPRFTWVSDQFLLDAGVVPFSELPYWLPAHVAPGLSSVDCSKAIQTGLTFRPLVDTARDTLAWDQARPVEDATSKRAMVAAQGQLGLLPEREQALLQAWHAQP